MNEIAPGGEVMFGNNFQANFENLQQMCREVYHDQEKRADMLPALLSGYFHDIYQGLTLLEQERFSNPIREMELEKWLIAIDMDELLNSKAPLYLYHPIILMNNWYKDLTFQKTREVCSDNAIAMQICDSIVMSKYNDRNKLNFRIYEKDYKVSLSDERVKPFEIYGSLAKIQDIRIITKVKNILEKKKSNVVNIAVFGELERVADYFERYFEDKEIRLDTFNYLYEDVFFRENIEDRINLKDSLNIQELLHQYDLILFLDESYFYKKFQSHKSFEEENYIRYIKILYERLQSGGGDEIQEVNLYYALYETARKILDSKSSIMSSNYEFDERLIKRFESIVKICEEDVADIYFYIHNEKIADKNIELLNVCKEENYDGKNINVYKISGKKAAIDTENQLSYNYNLKTVSVDMWKLIKSISNSYYIDYWKEYSIAQLMKVFVVFRIGETKDDTTDTFSIQYTIRGDGDEELIKKVKKFISCFISIATEYSDLGCIKRYLLTLLSNTLLSRANSVECALMAYWITCKESLRFEYISKDEWGEFENVESNIPYRERKQVYTIIEKLNTLLIRDMEKLEQILFLEFKDSYANDMDNARFEECIREIHRVCERLGDTKSRLYVCTNID